MSQYVWDWGDVVVSSGGWWIALITLLIAIIAFGIGSYSGYRKARQDYHLPPTV